MRTKITQRILGLLVALLPVQVVVAVPQIKTWNTANGAQVLYVHAPNLPMVDVRVTFRAGSAYDGARSGLAVLTNRMMTMGAGGKTANDLAELFDQVGAKQAFEAGRDSATFSLRSLVDKRILSTSVDTLAVIIKQPNFVALDLERERARTLTALKQENESPASIAERRFYQELYGSHPYAKLPVGTEASVKLLTRDDLVRFHQQYYVARNATVAVVGAIDETKARAIVQQLIGELPAGQLAAAVPPVPALAESKVISIEHPSTQTHIMIGHPGVKRTDADYFALYVANHALGGSGLVSRLGKEVREKRGLAYSVYSYFNPMGQSGPFVMGMQTKNTQANAGIKVLRQSLKDYWRNGISPEELEASRLNITGGFPLRVDSNSKIVEYLAMIGFYGLPLTYLDDFNGKINALNLQGIRETFRRRVNPERMITVIVGGK